MLVERCPESYEAMWDAGWAFFRVGRSSSAIPFMRRATDLRPDGAAPWWALGVALYREKLYDDAEVALRRSLSIQDSFSTRDTLCLVLVERALCAAEDVLREGVRLQPAHRERLEALADNLRDQGREEEARELEEEASTLPSREARKRGA